MAVRSMHAYGATQTATNPHPHRGRCVRPFRIRGLKAAPDPNTPSRKSRRRRGSLGLRQQRRSPTMLHPACDTCIEHIARGLIDRTLPKSDWTHAAHFAAALWLLRHRGDAAFSDMPPLIRAYNEATGVANTDTSGYHETITIASLRVARAWLDERPDMPLHAA